MHACRLTGMPSCPADRSLLGRGCIPKAHCHTRTIYSTWFFTFVLRCITILSRLSWKGAPDKPSCLKWPE